jgi:AcrR family transcriptional regulator
MGRAKLRNEQLKVRLLDGALRLAAEGGMAAVTTRAVAASADSSVPAVDELFGGKTGLVRAMFVEGFTRLAVALQAVPFTTDPEADVMETAWAFRRFALENRSLYEVMFSRPFAEFELRPDDLDAAQIVHRCVTERVDALVGSARSPAHRKDAALGLSAVMQGLAGVELAGILGSGSPSIERRWRLTVLSTVRGLTA